MVVSGAGLSRTGPKRQAEAFLVSVEADKLRGAYVDPQAGRIAFAVYAERWLKDRSFDESTRETTEYKVRKHLIRSSGTARWRRSSRGTCGSGIAG
jgi:hypothetical protein